MGYWPDTGTVVITDIIGPGPTATHTGHSFHPDVEYQDYNEYYNRESA